jgi:hypothetical protein
MVTMRRELVELARALRLGVVAVALEHQVRHAPNVDLGYHAAKVRGGSTSRKV